MVNPPYLRLVNNRDVLNKPLRTALPEAVEQGYVAILDKVLQGEPFEATLFALISSRTTVSPAMSAIWILCTSPCVRRTVLSRGSS